LKWINGVSIYSNILIDNITKLTRFNSIKTGGAEQTIAMVSNEDKVDKVDGERLINADEQS
jgi:uncharacterized membrane protein